VLFVTYFPHLIAGPIIHHREIIPQFDEGRALRFKPAEALGLSIFAIGLVKKTLLADGLAPTRQNAKCPTLFFGYFAV
jgi:alginate O-acetyltransferase complex protein AlgI